LLVAYGPEQIKARSISHVIENLTIINGGLFGRDHRPHCNPKIKVSRWPLTRSGNLDSIREVNFLGVATATAAKKEDEENKKSKAEWYPLIC
jgi:hypothetical protein